MTPDDDRCWFCGKPTSADDDKAGYCLQCGAVPDDDEPDDEPIRGNVWTQDGLDDMGGVDE